VNVEAAVEAAVELARNGAHVIDVGGESTRPGASDVPDSLEIARTRRVVEAIAKRLDVPISIDTRKAAVAEVALAAGARVVNDVSGLRFDPGLAAVAARAGAVLILGHSRGTPETMQHDPHYDDVVAEVAQELEASLARARAAGVRDEALAFDPGLGLLYVAAESGSVSVFARRGQRLESRGHLVMPHAHTVCVDPSSHLVYFPLESVGGRPVLRIMKPTSSE